MLLIAKNPHRKVGGRLDVTFVDEVCVVGETQATCTTEFKDVQMITFTCLLICALYRLVKIGSYYSPIKVNHRLVLNCNDVLVINSHNHIKRNAVKGEIMLN